MDRSEGYNSVGGPVGAEVTAAMYRAKCQAETVNVIYGLSGRDVKVSDVVRLYEKLEKLAAGENVFGPYPYLGLRSHDETDWGRRWNRQLLILERSRPGKRDLLPAIECAQGAAVPLP